MGRPEPNRLFQYCAASSRPGRTGRGTNGGPLVRLPDQEAASRHRPGSDRPVRARKACRWLVGPKRGAEGTAVMTSTPPATTRLSTPVINRLCRPGHGPGRRRRGPVQGNPGHSFGQSGGQRGCGGRCCLLPRPPGSPPKMTSSTAAPSTLLALRRATRSSAERSTGCQPERAPPRREHGATAVNHDGTAIRARAAQIWPNMVKPTPGHTPSAGHVDADHTLPPGT